RRVAARPAAGAVVGLLRRGAAALEPRAAPGPHPRRPVYRPAGAGRRRGPAEVPGDVPPQRPRQPDRSPLRPRDPHPGVRRGPAPLAARAGALPGGGGPPAAAREPAPVLRGPELDPGRAGRGRAVTGGGVGAPAGPAAAQGRARRDLGDARLLPADPRPDPQE